MNESELQEQISRPLPERVESERLILAAALTDPDAFPQVADLLSAEHFALEKHRRMFLRLAEINARGEELTYRSLADELIRQKQLDSVGGLSYLIAITDGMPYLMNLAGYCQQVRAAAIKRKAIAAAANLVERCYDPGEEAEELVTQAESIAELLSTGSSSKSIARSTEEIIEAAGGINELLSPQKQAGITIPFAAINATLSGIRKGKLIILGARPAVGKTAFATQIAEYAALTGKTVLFVTLEMSAEDVLKRSITGTAAVNSLRFRSGCLTQPERQRLEFALSNHCDLGTRLLYVDKSDITVQGIASLLQSHRARNRAFDLVVIDYLQLLSSIGRFETRAQEVASISRGLKKIAQRFYIPVLALSQLTRKEDHRKNDRPELDWLKESGQLEQDADQVLFLWAKKDPEPGEPTRNIEWRVAKNRDGSLNQGTLTFQATYCRFDEDVDSEARYEA